MKKCPTCNAVYHDEKQVFCFNDGTILVGEGNEQETVVLRSVSNAALPLADKKGVSPIFAYLAVALLALLIGGGAVAWMMSKSGVAKDAAQPEETKKAADNTIKLKGEADNTKIVKEPVTVPSASETPIPLTTESVRLVLNNWQSAQNIRDFGSYRDFYDASFKGVKRTASGSVSYYNYDQWIADRRKMIGKAKFMKVRIDKLQVSFQSEIATAQFDQYFITNGYGDFGPKIMKFKMTNSGPKIIYEELKSSTLLTD